MYLSNNINYSSKTTHPTLSIVSCRFVPSDPLQRIPPHYIVGFNVSQVTLRFPVIGGVGVICSESIVAREIIPIWVAVFESVFPVTGLLIGLSFILCGRCAVPQCFDNL